MTLTLVPSWWMGAICGPWTWTRSGRLRRWVSVWEREIDGEVEASWGARARDAKTLNLLPLPHNYPTVPQEPTLFSASIYDIIAFARPGATPADVEAAARAAGAHAFVSSLPQGYATLVGERGSHMSGGQRARIALARAFVRDPRILLLDEATAALDATSERAVQGACVRVWICVREL